MTRSHLLMAAAEKLQAYERVAEIDGGFTEMTSLAVGSIFGPGGKERGHSDLSGAICALLTPHLAELIALAKAKILADANEALVAAGCAPIEAVRVAPETEAHPMTQREFTLRDDVKKGETVRADGPFLTPVERDDIRAIGIATEDFCRAQTVRLTTEGGVGMLWGIVPA